MERIYTISEVASLTGINESTLRNWEREFSEYLVVSRDDQGARMYVEGDIERFKMIQLMRKKGFSIGAIRDLLAAFKNGERSSHDAALQVATAMGIIPKNPEQIKGLEVLQMTLQQLPEQMKNMVREELQREFTKHQEQVAGQIEEVIKTRVEKYRKPKRTWWKFGRLK